MRSTAMGQYRSVQHNLSKASSRVDRLYLQATTGEKFRLASDNPSAVGTVLSSRSGITMQERHMENIATAQDRMNSADSYLGSAENVMQRLTEITTAALNGSASQADLTTYANEVVTLKEQLLDVANAQVDGKYLFAGFNDQIVPFSGDPVVYGGTTDTKWIESGPGETVQSNLTGDVLFIAPVDVFGEIDALEAALLTGDSAVLDEKLATLEQAAEQIRSQRGILGSNNARLDDSLVLLEDAQLQLQSTLSRYEDADLTQVVSEMAQAEQALEAALAVSSRIASLSLLDYL